MTWNYRVFRQRFDDEEQLVIHEVHYDYANDDDTRPPVPDDAMIKGWTVRNVKPGGETIEELRSDLQRMLNALNAPILEEAELERVMAEKGRSSGARSEDDHP